METGLIIIGLFYIGISIWAVASLFLRSRSRPRRRA